jgi:hypothetical protein
MRSIGRVLLEPEIIWFVEKVFWVLAFTNARWTLDESLKKMLFPAIQMSPATVWVGFPEAKPMFRAAEVTVGCA